MNAARVIGFPYCTPISDGKEQKEIVDRLVRKYSSDPLGIRTSQERAAASTVLRIEPRGGNNLVVYMRKSDFETVVYPDRSKFVKAVGRAWCENSGQDSQLFLPSVYLTDIRTGEELASYSCVFDKASL